MNTKSKARAPGRRLTPHLERQDTNEYVSVGKSRGVTPQLKPALEELTIRSATVAAKKTWFHIVGNPDPKEILDEVGWDRYWADVEAEYGLGLQPFIEVIHCKHSREHRHRIYSLVRDNGRLVSVSHNYRRNEMMSRLCEIANNHSLNPGRHHGWVVGVLQARGIALPAGSAVRARPGVAFGQDEHQQAERKLRGGDPRPFRRTVYGMYVAAGGDWRRFAARLDAAGITVARGRAALLVVDEASTFHLPLARLLREEAKRAGNPIKITSADLESVFGRAKELPGELNAARERQSRKTANQDVRKEPEREKDAESVDEAFARRMASVMQGILDTERLRLERLRRNRIRNAERRRPTLEAAIANVADAACIKVAAHIVRCHRDERLARRTAVLWIAAIAAANGLAPVLLAVAAIGFVRRYQREAERQRFRADIDSVKAARAAFKFGQVPSEQRPAFAALARALKSNQLEQVPTSTLSPQAVAQFVAWWVHASDKQQATVRGWHRRPTPTRSTSRSSSRTRHTRGRGED